VERLIEWWNRLRYDRPVALMVLLGLTATAGIVVSFLWLPDVPILRAIGIAGLQQRCNAAINGVVWSTRAAFHQRGSEEHTQIFGNVEGIDKTGKLIATVAKGSVWAHYDLTLANIQVTDLYGVAKIVGGLRSENARFDIYRQGQAVVWIRNAPLNLRLIEAGVAKPDPNPPTNIFDQAFATYYWGVAKGRDVE